MGPDHCVYSATLRGPDISDWVLLTSKPLAGVFRQPTVEDHSEFEKLKLECIWQGNMPTECTKPTLLATTDMDKNGRREYWAAMPYKWDTGLSVFEGTKPPRTLLEVCVGCSD
jgi:hypothetical protein